MGAWHFTPQQKAIYDEIMRLLREAQSVVYQYRDRTCSNSVLCMNLRVCLVDPLMNILQKMEAELDQCHDSSEPSNSNAENVKPSKPMSGGR